MQPQGHVFTTKTLFEMNFPTVAWREVVRLDLKKCNLSEDLAPDRSEWRNIIHVEDPNIDGTRL